VLTPKQQIVFSDLRSTNAALVDSTSTQVLDDFQPWISREKDLIASGIAMYPLSFDIAPQLLAPLASSFHLVLVAGS
jgi:hypothetical protein